MSPNKLPPASAVTDSLASRVTAKLKGFANVGCVKILLADDHPMIRAGLAHLINKQPDMAVCCETCTTAETIEKLASCKPDLVVTDISMPGEWSGVEYVKQIHAQYPGLPIAVLSMHDETLYVELMLNAGARGYVMKGAGSQTVLFALRQVLAGKVYVSQEMSSKVLAGFAARKPRGSVSAIETLTQRENEILRLIGQRNTTREVAEALQISSKTVYAHRGHIKQKLGLESATALVHYAVRRTAASRSSAFRNRG